MNSLGGGGLSDRNTLVRDLSKQAEKLRAECLSFKLRMNVQISHGQVC